MKKRQKRILSMVLSFALILLNFVGVSFRQFVKAETIVVLSETFDGVLNGGTTSASVAPAGWSFTSIGAYSSSSTGYFGKTAPSIKFGANNARVITPTFKLTAQGTMSFWLRGASTDTTSRLLVEKLDGANWVAVDNMVLSTTGTTKTYSLEQTITQVRLTYTKSAGNVAFDDFLITQEGTTPPVVNVTGVSLDQTNLSLNVGQTASLIATVEPAEASNKAVTWSSSSDAVASVDQSGKVTANAAGTADITVTTTDGIKTASCKVTVNSNGDTAAPVITEVVPAEGSVLDLTNTKPTIAAKYNDGNGSGVNISSVKLLVDSIDVTAQAGITESGLTYLPSTDLIKGAHSVSFEVADNTGNITKKSWSFNIGQTSYNLYFGGLHSHTNLSDGTGSPTDAYTWARDNAKVDFLAVTDHSNWFDNDKASENITDISQSTSSEWKQLNQIADNFNSNGKFVAIGAFEMTWSGSTGGWGHINTFNTPWFVSRSNTAMGLQAYYDKISKDTNSISQLNHPGTTFGDFGDFGFYSQAADNVVDLIEVGNGEGPVRGNGYFPSYDYYTRALDKGWHLAPTNNQDNHKGVWGNANTARTVILAPELTRDSLYDAMRNRRVYSTEDSNLRVQYTVNNQQMGSILSSPSALNAVIDIVDPDATDTIGKVSIITDGGSVLTSKTFNSNSAHWEISLTPGYSYYYVRVDEADKDIAVTAPVWASSVVPVGISKVEVSQDPQVVNTPVDVTATVYNNGSTALSNVKVEFFKNSVATENKIGEATIATVASAGSASAKTTWTPTETGDINVYAQAVIPVDGQDKVFTNAVTFKVANAEDLFKVVIDAGHVNQYVSGDYAGKMLTLTSMMKEKKYQLVQNNDELTASDLVNARILIITDPQSKDTSSLKRSKFTDAEINVIKEFINNGGSLIITSRADYNDVGVTDRTYQSSVQGNTILEAIGSNLRFNDDEVVDNNSNGGQNYRLYFDDYTGSKYHLTDNVPAGETYSFYSGCSVISKDGADLANVDWLIKGHSTTEILDSDLQKDAVAVEKGNVYGLAAEVLPSGSRVIVAGSTFFSDFETAALDNAYSNKLITENVFAWISAAAPIKTIAEVRVDANQDGIPDNLGKRFAVEGRITAQSEAVTPKNAFFEVIYVQDETGGLTVFGVSKTPLPLGTKVRITGVVGQYQYDSQLALTDETRQVEILDSSIQLVDPKHMSTGDSMLESNEGWLVRIQGKVTRIEGQNLYVDDGTGEARAYVEGYIGDGSGNQETLGKWDPNIKVGDTVSVIGLASEDPAGHRLRVRNTAEITLVDTTAPVINVAGVYNNGIYNAAVNPTITVDDNSAVVTKTLNGVPYNGEEISEEGDYTLVIIAVDGAGNKAEVVISFVIDKTAPVITITGVMDGGAYNVNLLPVINVDDSSAKVTTLLNGDIYNGQELTAEGNYVLEVTAVDKAGNSSTKAISITIDKTAPSITVAGVETGKIYNTNITPVINVDDSSAVVTMLLNGVPYYGEVISAEGSYVLEIFAVDTAGNSSNKSISFIIDKTAPQITVTGVLDGKAYNTNITPVISVNDNTATVTKLLNGVPYNGETITGEGNYVLQIISVDPAGNKAEMKVSFIIDKSAPIITISGVVNNAVYNHSVTPAAGVNEVNAGLVMTLNGNAYTGEEIMEEGFYILEVYAFDQAGNSSKAVVSFTLTKLMPKISISGVKDGKVYYKSVTPVIKASGTYTALLNGKPYYGGTIKAPGFYMLEVTAVDKYGFKNRVTVSFTILN